MPVPDYICNLVKYPEIIKKLSGEYKYNYYVTSVGRVFREYVDKRCGIGKWLKPYDNSKGYLRVDIDGKCRYVHRLVAKTFLENVENKPDVNHKDGNKKNNALDNLEWVTEKENLQHSSKILGHGIGENHSHAKLNNSDIIDILNSSLNNRQLSKLYNVTAQNIGDIRLGKIWKNLLYSEGIMPSRSKRKGYDFEKLAADTLNKLIKKSNFRRVPGSGALGTILGDSYLTSDVSGKVDSITQEFKIECKVGYNTSKIDGVQQLALKKEWLDKVRDEASRSYSIPILMGKFSGAREGTKIFVAMDVEVFANLINRITELNDELTKRDMGTSEGILQNEVRI